MLQGINELEEVRSEVGQVRSDVNTVKSNLDLVVKGLNNSKIIACCGVAIAFLLLVISFLKVFFGK
jgi:hypothetical protein